MLLFDLNDPAVNRSTDEILCRRNSAVEQLLALCSTDAKRYTNPKGIIRCGRLTPVRACDTMMSGAVLSCLSSVNLMPESHQNAKLQLSAMQISGLLHGLKKTFFGFVRQSACTGSSRRRFCGIHGRSEDCPGPVFHEECNFLLGMLREVNGVIYGVVGLRLNDFESRKVG